MSTRPAVLIAAGSIAALLLAGGALAAAVSALGSMQGVFGIRTSNEPCLPTNFPSYSNAERAFAFTVGPICSEAFTSGDEVDQITSFFATQLRSWPWKVTATSSHPETINFGRQDSSQSMGEVQVFANQVGSRFTITYSP
jgi:hypothetical protein